MQGLVQMKVYLTFKSTGFHLCFVSNAQGTACFKVELLSVE